MLDRSREFLVLARCLSFVKAAESLHLSQPSLTRHIASLESKLGFKLFSRNPLTLTPAGQFYFDAISGVIEQFDGVVDQGRRVAAENSEGLAVNMVISSNNQSAGIMFEAMTTLHDRHPYAPAPHLLFDNQAPIADSVLSGQADVGIVFREPSDMPDGFACETLLTLPLSMLIHKDNPLSKRASVSIEDLRDCYLICPSSPHLQTTFEGAVHTFRSHGIEPKFRVREICEFDQMPTAIRHDEMLFKTAGVLPSCPTTFLVEMPLEPAETYCSYLLYNKQSANPTLPELVSICQDIAAKRND